MFVALWKLEKAAASFTAQPEQRQSRELSFLQCFTDVCKEMPSFESVDASDVKKMLDMRDSKLEILRTIAKEAVAEVNDQLTFLKDKSVDVKGILQSFPHKTL